MLRSHTMTPGQQDILRGTYSADFINRNAMCFAVEAPGLVDDSRIERGIVAMIRQHPVLRMIPAQEGPDWRQHMLSPDLDWRGFFVHDLVELQALREGMTAGATSLIEGFDVFASPPWGVARVRADDTDYLVFVFNHLLTDLVAVSHFIRTFIIAALGDGEDSLVPDTYIAYLEALEREWASDPSDDVRWWLERPWGEITSVPDLQLVDGALRSERVEIVDLLPERELHAGRLSEALLIDAVEQAIRDIAHVPITRIDAARVGRSNHRERSAGGWLSHAVPFVSTQESSTDLADARNKAAAWIAAFRHVRARPDLTTEDHFSAQVFVNFFGTFSPQNWTLKGFRVAAVQPSYRVPGRSSLTPFHLKVRKAGEDWAFEWSMSPQYERAEALGEMSTRTRALLSTNH